MRDVLADDDVMSTMDIVVDVAVRTVPGVHEASVSVQGDQRFRTMSASSTGIREVDEAQYQDGRGPCVEAIRSGEEVASNLDEDRWPRFEQQARDRGMGAVWSLPLHLADGHPGALNLYSRDPDAWPGAGEPARSLAAHAAVLLANVRALERLRRDNEHLKVALAGRTIIGQAQGVLIACEHITADEAFDILRRASQRENRKLRDIAAGIVARAQHRPS